MAKGGARPGAGRKAGSKNKKSAAMIAAAKKAGLLPHEWMLGFMRKDPAVVGRGKHAYKPTMVERLDAAKGAAPYYAPRLAAVVAKINAPGNPWDDLLKLVDGKSRGLPGARRPGP